MSENPIKCLSNSPLVDSICEIRFETPLDISIIPMAMISALNLDATKVESLPTHNIPEQIRNQDPNLKYVPIYKYNLDNYTLQFGPKAFAISAMMPYQGWSVFGAKISESISKLLQQDWIVEIPRIGMRAINAFEGDALEVLDYKIQKKSLIPRVQYGYTEILQKDKMSARVAIFNNAVLQNGTTPGSASILDIDAYIDAKIPKNSDKVLEEINTLHVFQKEIFFSLLGQDELNRRGPVYA